MEGAESSEDHCKSPSKQRKRKPSSPENGDNSPTHKIIKLDDDAKVQQSGENVSKSLSSSKKRYSDGDLLANEPRLLPPKNVTKEDHSEEKVKSIRKKHFRKRLKYLSQAVLDQMEFYFSDSNLSKDRYLKKLMEQSPDGYVDLTVFGNFNKLQALHKDGVSLKVLTKALGRSKVLKLSEDKMRVKRMTPFKEISADETDNRTVYVEYLPKHATHAWIQTTFAPCGKVMYVSLPKYQSTSQIKGFAFVEFQTVEEAEKACKMLNNPPPAKEGEKAGKFPKGNKTLDRLEKIAPPKQEQDSNEENIVEDTGVVESDKKKSKKKGKKNTVAETGVESDQPPSEAKLDEGMDVKRKKKKKKKKRQGLSQDECLNNEQTDTVGEVKNEDSQVKSESKSEKDVEVKEAYDAAQTVESIGEQSSSVQADIVEGEQNNGSGKRRKKKKKKRRSGRKEGEEEFQHVGLEEVKTKPSSESSEKTEDSAQDTSVTKAGDASTSADVNTLDSSTQNLGRRERKRLRQEDIRRKKMEREEQEKAAQKKVAGEAIPEGKSSKSGHVYTDGAMSSEITDSDTDDPTKPRRRKSDGSELMSCLKSKRKSIQKKVEFNPVPITQEFVREKEIRKRKRAKKDKLHLRVITKKEWASLKAEYLKQQKSHMTALKESLRELRQQENQDIHSTSNQGNAHVDLEDVFGTKRLKPTQDVKMAHVESLKFTPNVIVQWKSNHEMHRDKIRSLFKEFSGDNIAYIDAQEESKSGFIRFKDTEKAGEFCALCRNHRSFSARVLPLEKQESYWAKANADRMKKLGRKKTEKGSERIARKVFERNKTTFQEKPSRIVFKEESDEEKDNESKDGNTETGNEGQSETKEAGDVVNKEETQEEEKEKDEAEMQLDGEVNEDTSVNDASEVEATS